MAELYSDQISRSVVSSSLRPHESQHARPSCSSPAPGVHWDCPSSQWCHPAISSSVIPFSSCPQSLPASESFPVSQLFGWGRQSTRVSALASFLPQKSQGWSPSEWSQQEQWKVTSVTLVPLGLSCCLPFALWWIGLPYCELPYRQARNLVQTPANRHWRASDQ